MPQTTWDALRDMIAEPLGLVVAVTNSGNTITASTSFVSDDLQERFPVDDYFNNWWALFEDDSTSDANLGEIRRVRDYAATTGTVTIAGENLTAATGTTTVALHRLHPLDLRTQFNQARLDLFPHVGMLRDIRMATGQQQYVYTLPSTLRGKPLQVWLGTRDVADQVAQNQLTDGGFEIWTNATTLTNWTLTGTSASVNRETETTTPKNYAILQDTYSARLVSASSGETTLLETVTPDQATQGVEANISVWVYCLTSGRVSARVAGTDGSTHGGTGWELLTASATLSATATTVAAGIAVTAGAQLSFYVDEAILVLGQSEPLDREWTPLLNWRWVPPVAGAANGGLLEFPYALPEKRRIRILGRDVLTQATADATNIEIDGDQLQLVMDKTRELACRAAAAWGRPAEEQEYWRAEERRYRDLTQVRLNTATNSPWPVRRPTIPDWAL